MDINKITGDCKNKIIDLIIEDRFLEIKRLLDIGLLKEGSKFLITDIFDEYQWHGLEYFPGSWELGLAFYNRIPNSKLPITRHPEEDILTPSDDRRRIGAVYTVKRTGLVK